MYMNRQITSPTCPIGHLVALYHSGLLRLACVHSVKGNNLNLLLEDSSMISLNANRIVLYSRNAYPVDPQSLISFSQKLQPQAIDFQTLDPEGESLESLAQRLNLCEDQEIFTLLLHLKQNPHKYYQKHQLFFSRSPGSEIEFKRQKAILESREHYLLQVTNFFRNPDATLSDETRNQLIRELRLHLQGEKHEDLEKALKQVLPGISPGEIRARLGDTLPVHDPALLESGIPIVFLEDHRSPAPAKNALELTPITAFCIDDEDSRDFDDAISLRISDNEYILGIHVSNLALQIDPQHALFATAQERVSSVYLPAGIVAMLPPAFSEQAFSLISDSIRDVLSLYVRLDKKLNITGSQFSCDKIKISKNFSYKEVDRARYDAFWQPFFRISTHFREQRELLAPLKEKRFYYNLQLHDSKLSLKRVDMQSPARQMIEEFMVLYNRSLADFAVNQHIPMLFRNINSYYDAERDWQSSTAYLDTKASYHPGIGAEAYLHSTSPIRRFVDLVNQMQIVQHLVKHSSLFDEKHLAGFIPGIEKRILMQRDLAMKSERYWLLRFIEQHHMHSPLKGILKAASNGKFRVEILPWEKQIWVNMDAIPKDNEEFLFVVYDINWERQVLMADLIS
jgi:exoribonuclease-2